MTNETRPKKFAVNFKEFKLNASVLNQNCEDQILMIHGGARNQTLFDDLRVKLLESSMGSLAFDCIGHGQSEGQLSDSSLHDRTQQALSIIQNQNEKITACMGVSMGAYNAIQLSKQLNLHALILVVPGVYTPSAYHVNFGEQFSKIIRTENSWMNSDAWEILSTFKGKLLIVSAENDEVVPSAIPAKLYESAINTEWKHHMIVPNAIHKKFMEYVWNNENIKEEFFELLLHCVSN